MRMPDGSTVETRGNSQETTGFSIDAEDVGMAFDALTQYSDPISSIVREIVSNAYDAHVEIGNTDPVEVEFSQRHPVEGDRWFEVRDWGTGISPDRIKNVYAKFFKSTKRESDSEIGYFGLGAKSPLGYTDMFQVITRWDGIEYTYAIHKGQQAPAVTKLREEPTDESNGTTVRIPIESLSDWRSFKSACKKQLAYFDNVLFTGEAANRLENDFQIYRGENFIYRPEGPFETLHLVLGKAYYPLDFSQVSIDKGRYKRNQEYYGHRVPLGLYFPLEDQKELPLRVVWNRENVEYNQTTINTIETKLRQAKEEIQTLFDEAHSGIQSVPEWMELVSTLESNTFQVQGIEIPYTDKFVDGGVPMLNSYSRFFDKMPKDPFYMLTCHRIVDEKGYIDQKKNHPDGRGIYTESISQDAIYWSEDGFEVIVNKYIADQYGEFLIASPTKKIVDSHPENWEDLTEEERANLGLRYLRKYSDKSVPRSHSNRQDKALQVPRLRLKAMVRFEKAAIKHFRGKWSRYEKVHVPEAFKERERKQKQTKKKAKSGRNSNTFPLKTAHIKRGHRDNWGWDRSRWKYEKLEFIGRRGATIIYGFRDDDDQLVATTKFLAQFGCYKSYRAFKHKKMNVVKIAQKREKMFAQYPTAMHVDDFVVSDHPIFRRFVTARAIKEILPESQNFEQWEHVLPEIKQRYRDCKQYISDWSGGIRGIGQTIKNTRQHLIDHQMVQEARELRGYILKYPLLAATTTVKAGGHGEEKIDVSNELKAYVRGKSSVHPRLIERHHRFSELASTATRWTRLTQDPTNYKKTHGALRASLISEREGESLSSLTQQRALNITTAPQTKSTSKRSPRPQNGQSEEPHEVMFKASAPS